MFNKIKSIIYKKTDFGKTRYLNYLYQYDLKQFYKNSVMGADNNKVLPTKIRLIAHAIEKGLSLPFPKPGFGKKKIQELIALNEEYKGCTEQIDMQVEELVKATVRTYAEFQKKNNIDVSYIPQKYFEEHSSIQVGVGEFEIKDQNNFSEIAYARHSSRNFSERKISTEVILDVVKLAQTAPSACNRQATRVYACINDSKIDQIMKMHGGLNGFNKPAVIFVIAGELNLYQNEFERNTVFVDGGIFIMNLLYALNSFGILSCPIIWGSEPDMDGQLETILNIPHSHKIVALVVAGYPNGKKYKAALSPKRKVEDIVIFK